MWYVRQFEGVITYKLASYLQTAFERS